MAHWPVALRWLLTGDSDDQSYLLRRDARRSAGPVPIRKNLRHERLQITVLGALCLRRGKSRLLCRPPPTPSPHTLWINPDRLSLLDVGLATSTHQDDPRSLDELLCLLLRARDPLQDRPHAIRHLNFALRMSHTSTSNRAAPKLDPGETVPQAPRHRSQSNRAFQRNKSSVGRAPIQAVATSATGY